MHRDFARRRRCVGLDLLVERESSQSHVIHARARELQSVASFDDGAMAAADRDDRNTVLVAVVNLRAGHVGLRRFPLAPQTVDDLLVLC